MYISDSAVMLSVYYYEQADIINEYGVDTLNISQLINDF